MPAALSRTHMPVFKGALPIHGGDFHGEDLVLQPHLEGDGLPLAAADIPGQGALSGMSWPSA